MKLISLFSTHHQKQGRPPKPLLPTKALAWMLLLSFVAVYLVPFLLPGITPTTLAPLIPLTFVFIIVAVLLGARKGGLGLWLILTAGLVFKELVLYGFSWPRLDLIMTPGLSLSLLLFALAAGHFRHISQQLKQAQAALQKQALTDALTGLPNHRAIMDQLDNELDRARRYERSFSLLFFDADRFKQVNDIYGHTMGDLLLQQIGERASSVLRGGETLGRFGGEEFVILLPETESQEARGVAEEIRVAVAGTPMAASEGVEGLPMTVSLGIATYQVDGETAKDLLHQADKAMYLAKRLGRNQVRTAAESRQASADPAFVLLVLEAERVEAMERQGLSPQHLQHDALLKMITSLMALVERRDPVMNEHAHHVSHLATAIAQEMRLESQDVFTIGMAALLHDIGKVGLPDAILQKGQLLSPKERALLREHPDIGAQILDVHPFLHALIPAVRHHHERWDGAGYPDQLAGTQIPLMARIIAVSEAYDAMQRQRSSQRGRTAGEARTELQRAAGTQFDPEVVQALLEMTARHHEQRPDVQAASRDAS